MYCAVQRLRTLSRYLPVQLSGANMVSSRYGDDQSGRALEAYKNQYSIGATARQQSLRHD